MCLDVVTKRIDKPTSETVWVWKVGIRWRGELTSLLWNKPYSRGWNKAHIGPALGPRGPWYLSGFHGFTSQQKAAHRAPHYGELHRVRFRRVRTHGIENGCRVLVADEMFVRKACFEGKCDCKRRATQKGKPK